MSFIFRISWGRDSKRFVLRLSNECRRVSKMANLDVGEEPRLLVIWGKYERLCTCKPLTRYDRSAMESTWLKEKNHGKCNDDNTTPLPPFTRESAIQKVRLAEDAWNTRDPGKVALAYAIDSRWRNRSEFVNGRDEITAFLSRKWVKELDYRLIKELWAFTGNRIAVRFAYEWHDDSGHWYRSLWQ